MRRTKVAGIAIASLIGAGGGCSSDSAGDTSTDAGHPSAEAPPGERTGPWILTGVNDHSLSWLFDLYNASDVEQTTYVSVLFYDADGSLIHRSQCLNWDVTSGQEFVEPGEEVTIQCGSNAEHAAGMPDYDRLEFRPLDGFPTTQAERDKMGY